MSISFTNLKSHRRTQKDPERPRKTLDSLKLFKLVNFGDNLFKCMGVFNMKNVVYNRHYKYCVFI